MAASHWMVSGDRSICFEPCCVGSLTALQLLFGLKIISVTWKELKLHCIKCMFI